MKTIKKFTRGKMKGWNIRQTKDGYYHAYIGIVSQGHWFPTIKACTDWIKSDRKYPNPVDSPLDTNE